MVGQPFCKNCWLRDMTCWVSHMPVKPRPSYARSSTEWSSFGGHQATWTNRERVVGQVVWDPGRLKPVLIFWAINFDPFAMPILFQMLSWCCNSVQLTARALENFAPYSSVLQLIRSMFAVSFNIANSDCFPREEFKTTRTKTMNMGWVAQLLSRGY